MSAPPGAGGPAGDASAADRFAETAFLFGSREPLMLAGARCTDCGTVTFPFQDDCPRCADHTTERVELPRRGRLWTWTVQTYPPRPPFVIPAGDFEPFCLGYVDLGEVLVETRIDARAEDLGVGMELELASAVWDAPDGGTLPGYAFTPVGSAT